MTRIKAGPVRAPESGDVQTSPSFSADRPGVLSLPLETRYADQGIVSRTLLNTPDLRVVLFGFAAGQELTEHTSTRQALIQVLSGSCEVSLGGVAHSLRSGDLVWMPPGLVHAVKATERFSMLLTLAKPGGPMPPALSPTAGRIPLAA